MENPLHNSLQSFERTLSHCLPHYPSHASMIVRETIFSWGETVRGETTAIRLQVLQKYNLLKENKQLNLFPAQNMFKLL